MVQQRSAYLACGPSDCRITVLESAGAVSGDLDREGKLFSQERQINMSGSLGRDHPRCGPEPANEGPNPSAGASSLIDRRITMPYPMPGEILSGITPWKESLCASPRP